MAENNADAPTMLRPAFVPVPIIPEFAQDKESKTLCVRYAGDIWSGLKRMVQTPTGYPEDMTRIENGKEVSNNKTSPTNIGLFLASGIAARDLGLSSPEETDKSIHTVLTSLEKAKTHEGLFYNWYNTKTGDVVKSTEKPFVSTVDNAWLAVGLMTIRASTPAYAERANKILKQMNFPRLYDAGRNLFYGGYYPDSKEPTDWYYDILNTEARIASYVGISTFNIPKANYSRLGKFSPAEEDSSALQFQKNQQPFSSWGGSMFEALMPTLFVPEQEWSHTWEDSHKQYIQKQIQYGKQYSNGYWGYSPSNDPSGAYHEAGLGELAMKKGGYGVSEVITPHALFLSLPFMPTEAVAKLRQLEHVYPELYKKDIGFSDSVNVKTGAVANSYLSLDQEMILISLFNYLSENKMHEYLSPQLTAIKPLITALDHREHKEELPLAA